MAIEMILSVMAADRPGLVEALSGTVADHGGNWIDSSMARLGGEFAGILHVEIPDTSVGAFESALADLADDGITIAVRKGGTPARAAGASASFELSGADHPGIVRDISAAFARHGVSIDELHTQIMPGSMSGAPIFVAKGTVVIPEGADTDRVRDELEAIAQDILVEISFG